MKPRNPIFLAVCLTGLIVPFVGAETFATSDSQGLKAQKGTTTDANSFDSEANACLDHLQAIYTGDVVKLPPPGGYDSLPSRITELRDSRIDARWLFCPKDKQHKVLTDWTALDTNNISYLIKSGLHKEFQEGHDYILCPIHGFACLTDGTIKTSSGNTLVRLQNGWFDSKHAAENFTEADAKRASIKCRSNLKQIGLAFRLWAGDHGDQYGDHFPFNVSTNRGGTKELCRQDSDGHEKNISIHLQVMSNELNSPKILVCPADAEKYPAMNFQKLSPANVTYLIHTGTNVSEANANEVLVYCPVHGHVVYCDGRVVSKPNLHNEIP